MDTGEGVLTLKVAILDTEYPDDEVERDVLRATGVDVVSVRSTDERWWSDDVGAVLCQQALITAELMNALPSLGLVVRYGVGVDNVDLDHARASGIWVANVPDYGTEEVAAHAFAGAMACLRHLKGLDAQLSEGVWDYLATGPVRRLSTLTFGCVGLGLIGRMVAQRASPWFARVMAYDPGLTAEFWPQDVERAYDIHALFSASDVVSLHASLTDATRHLVNSQTLAAMKPGSVLVNCARGGLVEEEALITALASGHLSGAAIDTWETEPPPASNPLVGNPRVIVSPHAAWYSVEAEHEVRRRAAEHVRSWISNGRPNQSVVVGSRLAS